MIEKYKLKSGFAALFSVTVISFILVITAISLNFSGLYTRFNILDSETKERTDALAHACVETSRLKLAEDKNFLGKNTIVLENNTCEYEIKPGGEILASGSIGNIYTYYRATADLNTDDIKILTIEELAAHP